MSINLIEFVSKQLGCEKRALHEYLNHPIALQEISNILKNKKLKTNYLDRNSEFKEIKFSAFSTRPADEQPAYEGFLAVTVQQHYYCRHRIRLMYQRMRCVAEYGNNGHNKYYPMELVDVVEEEEEEEKEKKESENDEKPARDDTPGSGIYTPWFYFPPQY